MIASVDDALDRLEAGLSLSREEALFLYESPSTEALLAGAAEVRRLLRHQAQRPLMCHLPMLNLCSGLLYSIQVAHGGQSVEASLFARMRCHYAEELRIGGPAPARL